MIDLPKKVFVKELVKGRYASKTKPLKWDERVGGLDLVIDEEGKEYCLESTGDQSCPVQGWQILLTEAGNSPDSYKWTLYGIS